MGINKRIVLKKALKKQRQGLDMIRKGSSNERLWTWCRTFSSEWSRQWNPY